MDIFIDPQLQRQFTSSATLVQEMGALMIDGLSGQQSQASTCAPLASADSTT
jgi:hypothetical protein